MMPRSATGWGRIILGVAVLSAGCATVPIVRVDQGAPQAELLDLERKIQKDSDQLEQKLAHEGAIDDDLEAGACLHGLGQRLIAPEAQNALPWEFKIVRDPTVNAYALANGRSYYHLGLIAKMRNPDMLAAVMAHEMSHALNRDMLYRVNDLHQKTIAAKVAELTVVPVAAVFGAGGLASLTLNVAYAASVMGYGREKEAQADAYGIERLQAVGMNPMGIIQMFEVLLREDERYQRGLEIWFLMDHPATRRRLDDAKAWLAAHGLSDLTPPADDPQFLAITDPIRLETAGLNLRFERYFHALELVDDVLARRPDHAPALALRGECARRLADNAKSAERELSGKAWAAERAKSPKTWTVDWQATAQAAFERALTHDPNCADARRGLGFLAAARKERAQAIEQLEAYLQLQPEARDRRYVTSTLERLRHDEEAARGTTTQ